MIEHILQPRLKTIPTTPGVYVYKGAQDEVLYVGKAKNLRNRVKSYFVNYRELTARIQIMIDNSIDLEIHSVESEIEALLLEASLIKKYKPKYNVLLKDDKQYSWIKITKDPYPIIYRARNTKDKNATYFGPFPNTNARDTVLKFLRKEFPFRTCSYAITDEDNEKRAQRRKNGERVLSRLCTYYHIGLCGGPCEGQISQDNYLENINNLKKFLQNKKKVLIKDLESKMKYRSQNFEFEKAAKIKDQIDALKYISQKVMIGYGDDEDDVRRITYQRSMKGLEYLIKELKISNYELLSSKAAEKFGLNQSEIKQKRSEFLDNFRIECYDISNISGTNPVGAMVVFQGGIMRNDHYRKFKINIKETPDDFAMMREMLTRRFRYIRPTNNLKINNEELIEKLAIKDLKIKTKLKNANIQKDNARFNPILKQNTHADSLKQDESFGSIPNLIIIDGGKGQLGIAVGVANDFKLHSLNIVGLAKKREEIFVPGEKVSHTFDNKPETLFLIQRIRDEAHRFGLTYHRLRRSKAMLQ
jgi:excinuclease ABC subunit C